MAEPKTTTAQGQGAIKAPHENWQTEFVGTDVKKFSPQHVDKESLSPEAQLKHSLLIEDNTGSTQAPLWLRPFFSLHTQLFCAYSVLLTLAVLLMCALVYIQPSRPVLIFIAVTTVIGAALLAYFVTMLLLRPLWRVIDAAQAIAIGDLQQRERLPLRQPPQDEVDRLAGSIYAMVTHLEHAEELQHASEQRFKRFFSDASHQLRTPLTSIRGFTEILMRGAINDQDTRQHVLSRMKSEAERMTSLINDLLTLARNDDKQSLKLQYVDLREVTMEAIKEARQCINNGRKISLSLLTDAGMGMQADKERLKYLLFILLDNALKYGRLGPDGIITVQLDQRDLQFIIQVSDNGEGIDKEDRAHIFDSFYRGRHRPANAALTPNGGAGMGLSIDATIVHAHHGTISVSSEPGKETQFVVTLPSLLSSVT